MTVLYAFGSNGSGQLGVGHTDDIYTPQRCVGIPETESLVKVVGGGNHAAALTKSGQIYMTGDSHSTFYKPSWLQDHTWIDVACGWSFTLVVSDKGRVYGFGTAKSGELGSTTPSNSNSNLVAIDNILDTRIVTVACGWRHAVALDENGKVYGWGWNRHGQIGPVVSQKPYIQGPSLIELQQEATSSSSSSSQPASIEQIACGHTFTLLRAKDGTLYGFGSNKYGQLDTSHIKSAAQRISTGWHHAAAVLENDDRLHAWGRNDHAQSMSFPDPVEQFVCGSEHMLVLHKNKAFAWGWNEHGNCTSNKESVLESLEVAGLPKGKIVLLGAGCATSWIAIEPFICKG